MSASKSLSCPLNLRKLTIRHSLAIVHLVLMIVMSVCMRQIHNMVAEQQFNIKTSALNAVMNGVPSDPQNFCLSSSNIDTFKKFDIYKEVVFWSIFASFGFNLWYLAFEYKLPTDKWVPTMVYGPLMVVGIIGMALSVDGFLKIRSLASQPADCAKLIQLYKTFFILSISISVVQATFAIWILKDLYIKVSI
jgi:hypothetical protein